MTTEHVSVPRELAALIEQWKNRSADALPVDAMLINKMIREAEAILSRDTPSDELQGAFAECYISTTGLETLRTPGAGIATVGRAKTDYSHIPLFLQPQPSAPRVVTDEDVERAIDAYDKAYSSNNRGYENKQIAMRAALQADCQRGGGVAITEAVPNKDMDIILADKHHLFVYEVDFGDEGKGRYIRLRDFNAVVSKLEALLAQRGQVRKWYAHQWDRDGERCVKCGDKDWMGGKCSVPDADAEGNGNG